LNGTTGIRGSWKGPVPYAIQTDPCNTAGRDPNLMPQPRVC
jgi:hypothetical protein